MTKTDGIDPLLIYAATQVRELWLCQGTQPNLDLSSKEILKCKESLWQSCCKHRLHKQHLICLIFWMVLNIQFSNDFLDSLGSMALQHGALNRERGRTSGVSWDPCFWNGKTSRGNRRKAVCLSAFSGGNRSKQHKVKERCSKRWAPLPPACD